MIGDIRDVKYIGRNNTGDHFYCVDNVFSFQYNPSSKLITPVAESYGEYLIGEFQQYPYKGIIEDLINNMGVSGKYNGLLYTGDNLDIVLELELSSVYNEINIRLKQLSEILYVKYKGNDDV